MPQGTKFMSRPNWLQKIYWTRFAKPIEDRELFKQLISRHISSVLEIGVGDGSRMQRIAQLTQLASGTETLRYIGTDEFESARDNRRHLTLKQAHQKATQLGFKASLIPGDVNSAIPRVAHKLGASDLVIVEGGLDPAQPMASPFGAWLNRLAHSDSVVLACAQPGTALQIVNLQNIELPSRIAA